MIDQSDVFARIRLTGNEMIRISFWSTPLDAEPVKFHKVFSISSVEQVANTAQNRAYVVVNFASRGMLMNEKIKISRSWSSTGIHLIVHQLLTVLGYTDPELMIEPTIYNKDIVVPNLSPLKAIEYLTQYAQSGNDVSDSAFYCYETRDGVRFESLSSIKQRDPVKKLAYSPVKDATGFDQISKLYNPREINVPDAYRSGAAGAVVHSHSLVNKSYKVVRTTPEDVASEFGTLNQKSVSSWEVNQAHQVYLGEDQMYSNINQGARGNSVGIRDVQKGMLRAKRRIAQMSLDTEITVGDVIELKVSAADDQIDTDSGRWIVSRIKRVISRTGAEQDLELVSDSDTDPL